MTVPTARLDESLTGSKFDGPVLLKTDVQGGELGVLRGGEALLASIDDVYVECSFVELYEGQALAGQVVGYLEDHGFAVTGEFGMRHDRRGHCLQADVLFVRR